MLANSQKGEIMLLQQGNLDCLTWIHQTTVNAHRNSSCQVTSHAQHPFQIHYCLSVPLISLTKVVSNETYNFTFPRNSQRTVADTPL